MLTRRLQQDPELPGVGLVDLRRGPRAQPDDRPRPGVHARRGGDAAARPADRWRCRRPPTPRCSPGCWPTPAARRRSSRAPGGTYPVDVRWVPRGRDDRLEAADRPARSGGRCATRTATCSSSCPASARSPASPTQLATRRPGRRRPPPRRRARRSRSRTRRWRPSPPGRRRVVLATDIAETSLTVDGVRVVVDSGLARAPRFDAGTGMTRLTTVSISRDSADQRAGPGRADRARRRLPAVEPDGARHPPGPPRRPRSPRSTWPGCALELAAWGTPAEQLAFVDPPPAQGRAGRPSSCCTELGALDADGAHHRRSAGRWSACPSTPAWPGWSPARPDCAVVRRRRRSSTSATCCAAARDELPADLALRVAVVCGHAPRRPRRPAGRRPGARAGGRHRPPGRRPLRRRRRRPRRRRRGAARRRSPTGWPARRRPGQFQLRNGTGAWVADDDPLATAPFVVAADLDGKRTDARIRLGAAVDAAEIAALLAGVVEDRRLEWDDDRRRPRRAGRAPPRRAAPRRGAAPAGTAARRRRRALVGRVRATQARRPAVDAGDVAAAGAGRVPAPRRSATPWPDVSDAGAAGDARRVAGAVPRRRDRPGRPRPPRPRACCCASQLPWPLGADLDELAPRDVDAARRAARRRSTTRANGRRSRCGCRTCSACTSTRRSPAAGCR